jgi:hypothetical protein
MKFIKMEINQTYWSRIKVSTSSSSLDSSSVTSTIYEEGESACDKLSEWWSVCWSIGNFNELIILLQLFQVILF